jgi:hypothetical protein
VSTRRVFVGKPLNAVAGPSKDDFDMLAEPSDEVRITRMALQEVQEEIARHTIRRDLENAYIQVLTDHEARLVKRL